MVAAILQYKLLQQYLLASSPSGQSPGYAVMLYPETGKDQYTHPFPLRFQKFKCAGHTTRINHKSQSPNLQCGCFISF